MRGGTTSSRGSVRGFEGAGASGRWQLLARVIGLGVTGMLLVISGAVGAERIEQEPRERVAHHLREAEAITRHFEAVLGAECPLLASREAWEAYLEREVDRAVLLVAHLRQAWREAKRTEDQDLQRAARAPRERAHQAQALVEKLRDCAGDNGDALAPLELLRRMERDVPRRQAEIRLPG